MTCPQCQGEDVHKLDCGFQSYCLMCSCFRGTHGGCVSRGHDTERCHGIHTMFACTCDCCEH